MFTSDEIQRRVHEKPFVPIRIITSAGEHYDIYHPELIMVGRRFVAVGTASEKNPTQFDRLSQVSIMHITALEKLPLEAGLNGKV